MKKLYLVVLLFIVLLLGWWLDYRTSSPVFETNLKPVVLTEREAEVSSGQATSLRLVLQFSDNEIKILSSLPRRSAVSEPRINLGDLLAERAVIIAYRSLDANEQQVSDGLIVVPLVARAEFQDPQNENKLQRFEERVAKPTIRLSIPFHAEITSLEFSRLVPDEKTEVVQWEHLPLNTHYLDRVDRGNINEN